VRICSAVVLLDSSSTAFSSFSVMIDATESIVRKAVHRIHSVVQQFQDGFQCLHRIYSVNR
jgi:hypothetical protein